MEYLQQVLMLNCITSWCMKYGIEYSIPKFAVDRITVDDGVQTYELLIDPTGSVTNLDGEGYLDTCNGIKSTELDAFMTSICERKVPKHAY